MNILYLTYGVPYPPHSGARLRDFHLIRQLASHHRVTCVCLAEPFESASRASALRGVQLHAFPQVASVYGRLRNAVRQLAARHPLATSDYHSGPMFDFVRSLVSTQAFDAIQIEHSFLAPFIQAINPALRGRTILDMHNIGERQYQRAALLPLRFPASLIARVKALLMRHWEVPAARQFAVVTVTSSADAQWMSSRAPDLRVGVVENGVDSDAITPLPETAGPLKMLFVGAMGYLPNIDAMRWFCTEILPRVRKAVPGATLEIVGRRPGPLVRGLARTPGVRVSGCVDDLAPCYRDARIVVVPVRAGGGTRLKILEAMAYGRPVISTTAGADGLDVTEGDNILLADHPERFAAQIARLSQDAAERLRLARNARTLVETRYSWNRVGEKLRCLYASLA